MENLFIRRPINDIPGWQVEETSKKAFKLYLLASWTGHAYGQKELVDANHFQFLREREKQCFKNARYWDGVQTGLSYLRHGLDPCMFKPDGSIDDNSELKGFIDGYNIRDYRHRIGAPKIEGHENYDLTSEVLSDPNFLDHNLIFAKL